jgi:DNA-binding transcriptional MerR regulator
MEPLTTKEVADQLGVSISTVKNWSSRFAIEKRFDSQGNRRYSEKDIRLFEIVKSLREDDRGYETITRRIRSEVSLNLAQDNIGDPGGSIAHVMDFEPFVGQVVTAISANNEIAERLSQAQYRIGELEATLRYKDEEIARLERELVQMSAKFKVALNYSP